MKTDLKRRVKAAFERAICEAGNMARLGEKTGLPYSVINKLNSGQSRIGRMSLDTLERLFPELTVYFFRDELPPQNVVRRNTVEAGGKITGKIVQNGKLHEAAAAPAVPGSLLDLKELERRIRKSDVLTPEERLKFLDFLDEEL